MASAHYMLVPLRGRGGIIVGWTKVDPEDYEMVVARRWHRQVRGYAAYCGPRAAPKELLHRMLLGLRCGDGMVVDHINHDPLDNRRSNLRVVTQAENVQNMRGQIGRTSIHRGVSWDAPRGKWKAQGKADGRNQFIGRFDDEERAAEAAREFRQMHMAGATD